MSKSLDKKKKFSVHSGRNKSYHIYLYIYMFIQGGQPNSRSKFQYFCIFIPLNKGSISNFVTWKHAQMAILSIFLFGLKF